MSTKKNCKYSKESLRHALDAIKNGVPCSTAAKQYNIPRTTLIGKIRGIYPEECRSGAPSLLSSDEENILVKWIINMGRMGFPVTKDQLLDSVCLLMKNLNRSNNFTNGRPGRHWYELFSKRHPEIRERIAQNLCASRAAVTESKIKNWHKEIEDYFNSSKINVTDPKRIFNTDESAFFLSPKGRKILAKKGSKSLHDRSGDDKECLTVLITGNAIGQLAPPMVMYAYERIPKHVVSQVPKGWGIGKSTSGWMTSESFFEYISNIFYPWLLSENIEFPVILYLDGHKSHVTLPLTEFCREKQIIVISLLPNSTHILQPLDVGLFKSLKMKWKNEVQKFKIKNNYKHLGKDTFAVVLDNSLKSISHMESIFKNSFKTCGLFPFNADNIDYSKLLTDNNNNKLNDQKEPDPEIVMHLRYLESFIDPEVLNKCYDLMGADWTGKIEDTGVYDIWYRIYQKSGLPQNNEKTLNVEIDVEEGLILEDGWENLVIFGDNQENRNTLFEEEMNIAELKQLPSLIDIEIEEAVTGNKENIDTRNISNVTSETQFNMTVNDTEKEQNVVEAVIESIEKEPTVTEVDEGISNVIEIGNSSKIKIISQHILKTPEKQPYVTGDEQPLIGSETEIKNNSQYSEVLPGIIIPSPFKKSLFWPEPVKKVNSSRNRRVKVPSVGTSDAWREYFLKKEEEQNKSIKEKEERKRKRDENKRLREEKIKKTRSKKIQLNVEENAEETEIIEDAKKGLPQHRNTTETIDNRNVDADIELPSFSQLKINNFIIVSYLDEYYPAQITNKSDNEENVLAKAMTKTGTDKWKWPNPKDEIWYDYYEIVEKIEPPVEVNKRGSFAVKELEKYNQNNLTL